MAKSLKLCKSGVWGELLMLKPCVGSPGDRGALCPLHQTSVVFMQRWVACWDQQSGPMAFGLGDTKISFQPPPTSRVALLYVLRKTVKGWHFSALISARALYASWKIYSSFMNAAALWWQGSVISVDVQCSHWQLVDEKHQITLYHSDAYLRQRSPFL